MPAPVLKGSEDATHELTELEVFELSLVDRPANKWPFLIVKNAGPPMPKGTPITTDENGQLVDTAKGGFSSGSKTKIKGALSAASKTLATLADAVSAAEDESAFMKRVAAAVKGLGGGAGGTSGSSDSEDKDTVSDSAKDASNEADKSSSDSASDADEVRDGTVPDFRDEQLDKMEASITTAIEATTPAPEPTAAEKSASAQLKKLEKDLTTVAKAMQTLTTVVKTSSGTGRPASQTASPGETPKVQKSEAEIWRQDMNSNTPDADENFVN